jgi:muramoyltetrapeptide carboxypeptidase
MTCCRCARWLRRGGCAGCLSLLAGAAGTPWALDTSAEDTILFIEDVDEPPYRIDRMLRQLAASGALSGVRGLVFGDMKGCSPRIEADYTLEEVVTEALAGVAGPLAFGLSSGHSSGPNVTATFHDAQRQRENASTIPSIVVIPMVPATAAP